MLDTLPWKKVYLPNITLFRCLTTNAMNGIATKGTITNGVNSGMVGDGVGVAFYPNSPATRLMHGSTNLAVTSLECEKNSKVNMDSHPQESASNMAPCIACAENLLSHTVTGAEKRCNTKTQRNPKTVLWYPVNHFSHIKR